MDGAVVTQGLHLVVVVPPQGQDYIHIQLHAGIMECQG